jgi:hypothetical protein
MSLVTNASFYIPQNRYMSGSFASTRQIDLAGETFGDVGNDYHARDAGERGRRTTELGWSGNSTGPSAM